VVCASFWLFQGFFEAAKKKQVAKSYLFPKGAGKSTLEATTYLSISAHLSAHSSWLPTAHAVLFGLPASKHFEATRLNTYHLSRCSLAARIDFHVC
jgi:hypothetical protein